MFSPSRVSSTLNQAQLPLTIIYPLTTMLEDLARETRLLMGNDHFNNLHASSPNGKKLKDLLAKGIELAKNPTPHLSKILKEFSRAMELVTVEQQANLNDIEISIPSQLQNNISRKFSDLWDDLWNRENSTVNCFFTFQIYLWQLLDHQKNNTTPVPTHIQKLATAMWLDIKPCKQMDDIKLPKPMKRSLAHRFPKPQDALPSNNGFSIFSSIYNVNATTATPPNLSPRLKAR